MIPVAPGDAGETVGSQILCCFCDSNRFICRKQSKKWKCPHNNTKKHTKNWICAQGTCHILISKCQRISQNLLKFPSRTAECSKKDPKNTRRCSMTRQRTAKSLGFYIKNVWDLRIGSHCVCRSQTDRRRYVSGCFGLFALCILLRVMDVHSRSSFHVRCLHFAILNGCSFNMLHAK